VKLSTGVANDTIRVKTIWWTAGAGTPQLLADGEIFMGSTYNGAPVQPDCGTKINRWYSLELADVRSGRLGDPAGLSDERLARVMDYVYFRDGYAAFGGSVQVHLVRSLLVHHLHRWSEPMQRWVSSAGTTVPTEPSNAENTFVNNYEWWADYRIVDDLVQFNHFGKATKTSKVSSSITCTR
jgi:putative spermidine/putrescine transport system substrate-binding protein